jgi:hypothetical protein
MKLKRHAFVESNQFAEFPITVQTFQVGIPRRPIQIAIASGNRASAYPKLPLSCSPP